MLPHAPPRLADPTGHRHDGAFEGALERVDWDDVEPARSRSPLARAHARATRFLRHKRWWFAAVSTPEVLVSTAIVHLGYAINAFVFAADMPGRCLLLQRAFLGLPALSASIAPRPGFGAAARFRAPGASIDLARSASAASDAPYHLAVAVPGLTLEARLDMGATAPLTWIGPLGDPASGRANCTQKVAAAPVSGSLVIAGRVISLDGSLGGLDFTDGLLHRETRWRWAFAQGQTVGGETLGLNLVEGFNSGGAAHGEDAVWLGGRPHPLGPARFDHDRDDPRRPWRITTSCGAADLTFTPGGRHAERHDLGVARSRFLQVAGHYDGTVTLAGRVHVLRGVPGVAEDQAVRW
jgi:hypothetical protein